MNAITIDRNIPVPVRSRADSVTSLMRDLKVNDSFRKPDTFSKFTLYEIAGRIGITITQRKVNEKDGWNGIRCWRVK